MAKAKILVVDDNYEKVQGIAASLKEFNFEIKTVLSARCALMELKSTKYELLVLDLQIPEALGEDIDPDGGVKLLRNIADNVMIKKPKHILGFTSHQDSFQSSKNEFDSRGWLLHLFNGDFDVIKSAICSQLQYSATNSDFCDVVIVTALEHTELETVLKQQVGWEKLPDKSDPSSYYKGTISSCQGNDLSIVAVCCHGMGMANAASITMKACLKFSPQYVLMTGIAAGIEGKVKLGDILIAETCWDWGNGKQTLVDGKPQFLAAPKQEIIDESLRIKLRTLATNRDYLDEIYNNWPSSLRPSYALSAHLGPLASGAVVLEDPNVVAEIKRNNRETVGVEMEAYGVMLASRLSSSTPPKSLVIKSVCDFADPSKDDSYQGYAAHTSTSFAFKVIENILDA
ncbi:hypothetical protein R7R25_04300 [Vibrio sp. 2026]|jgi:Nucleoside phosphorylase|uniref:phosphorylase family protein n=1 Tax=unclassified Vibrio TaxID=2614977 RepID=UPI001372917B|nr:MULTISPECIES: hypothetical protein [unclassified Vibrio]EJG0749103.1 hypothetical protein [Vibrio parahaemolyticus]NAW96690.1 hypothetical protein [Vibrio sp. V42_P2S4T144]CAH0527967.1 5'-methylthioadenosine/S-adenosylhomocysteine nucleosidase [Catenococcus thiocycli]HDU8579817.1 hypothetical protein [Vibrio diabolicus]MDG2626490.1 hypothetical protein [Vibrio parahaemolyticus]